jgi:hypothetical protein
MQARMVRGFLGVFRENHCYHWRVWLCGWQTDIGFAARRFFSRQSSE